MFLYCAQCGLIANKKHSELCPVCENELKEVPSKYLSASKNLFLSQDARELFIKEVIEANEAFDVSLANERENILKERARVHKESVAQKVQEYQETRPVLRCPVCGSSNLSTISNVGKVVKISLIGVWGAGDLGKKRHCNSCGHKF